MGRVASSEAEWKIASAGRCPRRTESRCGSESAPACGNGSVPQQAGESAAQGGKGGASAHSRAAFDPLRPRSASRLELAVPWWGHGTR